MMMRSATGRAAAAAVRAAMAAAAAPMPRGAALTTAAAAVRRAGPSARAVAPALATGLTRRHLATAAGGTTNDFVRLRPVPEEF